MLIDSLVFGGVVRVVDGIFFIMVGMFVVVLEKGCLLFVELLDLVKLYIVEGGIGVGSNMKMVY